MREFFRGWQRKMGCITLLVACVCAGAWMRGLIGIDDTITIDLGERYFVLCLNNHWTSNTPGVWIYECVYHETFNPRWLKRGLFTWDESSQTWAEVQKMRAMKEDVRKSQQWDAEQDWEWERGGFGLAGNVYSAGIGAPYWFFVLPPTLFSACLLLIKPKRKHVERCGD